MKKLKKKVRKTEKQKQKKLMKQMRESNGVPDVGPQMMQQGKSLRTA